MAQPRKVFIYNGEGTGPLSVFDLNTLFTTSKKIFPSRPDVATRDFDFNMGGLTDPVFVVPGGSTCSIGFKLKPQIDKIKLHFKENFSYVGICAGAFLGAADADLFVATHQQVEPVEYLTSTKKYKIALNIINAYQAFGAFYPDNSHLGSSPKPLMPYRVTLSLSKTDQKLSQLYVAGPAFVPCQKQEEKSLSEVVATYVGHQNYTLYSNWEYRPDMPLAAIVRKRPQKKQGGNLLAAPHIETCVPNSQLLTFFKNHGPNNAALNKKEYDLLVKEQESARIQVESLLQETLKLIP